MGSRAKKSRGRAVPVFHEVWLPGQKESTPQFVGTWKKMFEGDLTSPTAQMLQQITGEAAMREIAQQRQQISEMKDLTTPAKAKAIEGLSGAAIGAMARTPQDVWKMSSDILTKYALAPPQALGGQVSKTSGGGGWSVCCFIFIASKQKDSLLSYVRRYKDSHFSKTSLVAQGYKRLALILVPLMKKSKFVEKAVKIMMVDPMSFYAKSFYEGDWFGRMCFYPISKLWVTIYKLVGLLCGESQWKPYLRLGELLK